MHQKIKNDLLFHQMPLKTLNKRTHLIIQDFLSILLFCWQIWSKSQNSLYRPICFYKNIIQTGMKKVVLLLSLIMGIVGQFQALNCFRTEYAILVSGGPYAMVNQLGGYNTTITWSKLTVGIVDHIISFMGFKMSTDPCVYLSYEVQLSHTQTYGILNLNPINSKIMYLQFRIALITTACSKDLQVVRADHHFTYLNQSGRVAADHYQFINLTMTRFNFTPNYELFIIPFLAGVKISASCSLGAYHMEYYFYLAQPNKNNFSLLVRTWYATFRMDVMNLYVLVWSRRSLVPNFVYHYAKIDINSTVHYFPLNYNVPAAFYNQSFQEKCISLTWRFRRFLNYTSTEMKYIRVGNNVTDLLLINGINEVFINTLCLMQCQEGYYNDYAGGLNCLKYTSYVSNCIAYTPAKKCTACRTDYFLISPYFCSQCNGIGRKVSGGCTKIIGCIDVQKQSLAIYPTVCLACDSPSFYLDAGGICRCTDGQIVTELCIKCYGCISAKEEFGKTVCMACDVTANFTLVGDLCQCKVGFQQTYIGTCEPKCGDGLRFYSEDCDDGNSEAEDGCYSCKIEPFFKCENGSETSQSRCRYIGKINITYEWADKIENENRGLLSFRFQPSLTLFAKLNSNKYFYFASSAKCSTPQWNYLNSQFRMEVDFYTDLEETAANFTFSFDPALFIHKNISRTIDVRSRGVKLRLVKGLKTAKILSEVMMGITATAVFAVAMGSTARKMIGIEALQLCQLLFFAHLAAVQYTEFYSKVRMFGCVSGNPYFYFNHFSSFSFPQSLSKVPFDPNNTEYSVLFLTSLLLLCLTLTASLSLAASFHPQSTTLIKVKHFSLQHLVFPIAAGSWFPATLFACTLSFNYSERMGEKILILCAFTLCVAVYLIIFYEWKHLFVRSKAHQEESGKHYNSAYVPVFLSCTFVQLVLVVCTSVKIEVYLRESLGLCALVMLVWQLKVSPYRRIIHNAGIFLNQLTIALFCLWSRLRDSISFLLEEENEVLVIFSLVLLLCVCLILTIVRTILSIKQDCAAVVNQNALIKWENKNDGIALKFRQKTNKLIEYTIQGNPYSFFKQKKEDLLGYYRNENQK